MRGDDSRRAPPAGSPDAALWRTSRVSDAPEDEAERYLELAGFADGRLDDPDDCERVAEWLAGDPAVVADIAAARALATLGEPPEAAPDPVIARACALVEGAAPQRDTVVIPFPQNRREGARLRMAGWGSLVAAMAVASWLGFTLGMDTSLSFAQTSQAGEEGFLGELLSPSTDFMRDLTEGTQT